MDKIKEGLEQENQKFLPLLVMEMTDYAIFLMTADGIVSTWNAGAELIKGYKREEVLGKHYRMLFPKYLQEERKPELDIEVAINDGRYEEKNWRQRKNGDLFWARIILIPLYDDNKKLLGLAKITQDLTKERDAEIARTDFINFVSHELRTPISNVKAYAQLMERCIKENRECDIEKYLNRTQSLIDRLNGLVHELHESNKAEIDKIQIEKNPFNFEELINDNLEALSITYPEQKIDKEGTAGILINADANRVTQVFLNFITNAIKYSGGKEIKVKLIPEKEKIIVAVIDKGNGLTKEQKEKMFTKYYRVEDTSKIEGLGIGLYLSKKIIDAHHGEVGVESQVGKGSTFYFSLPR